MQIQPYPTKSKLDVRMQVSLSRGLLEEAKKLKPPSVSISAYLREALEEKVNQDLRQRKSKTKTVGETIWAVSHPIKGRAPSVASLLAKERELRQEK